MVEVPLLLWRPRRSSEIHAAGEREIRIFKGFRRRLNYLTPRGQSIPQKKVGGKPTIKPRDESARTSFQLAEAHGMSRTTREKAVEVLDAAKENY